MKDNFERCLRLVLDEEGGFSDHPQDSGGRTKWGITEREYRRWKHDPHANIMDMTQGEMHRIYREDYWDKVGADDLPAGFDLLLFDTHVNGGHAKRWYAACGGDVVRYQQQHLAYLRSLRVYRYFGKGWEKRQRHMTANALQMQREASMPPCVPAECAAAEIVYRIGSPVSEAVRAAQRRLNELGYAEGQLAVDGAYGPRTMSAVSDFEHINGLTMDGILDAREYAVLMSEAAKPWPLPVEAAGGIEGLRAAGDAEVKAADDDKTAAVLMAAGGAATAAKETGVLDLLVQSGKDADLFTQAVNSLVSVVKLGLAVVLPAVLAFAALLLWRRYGARIRARVEKWSRPVGAQ